jgi:hypothetical protein
MSVVGCQWSDVSGRVSVVGCLESGVRRRLGGCAGGGLRFAFTYRLEELFID